MSQSGKGTEKVPLSAKLGLGLLNLVGKASSRTGKGGQKEKRSTVISFGFGGPFVTRETYPENRRFTFRILSAADAGDRGAAISGICSHGEVHAGDTVTCVTADGRRFPCLVREVQQFFPNAAPPDPAHGDTGMKNPPFYTLFISGHSPEEFHPQDKFIIEAGEHNEQRL